MTKAFTLTLLAILLSAFLLDTNAQVKRNTPYPILFVHGWTGSDKTWFKEIVHLKDQGLNVDIDYAESRAGAGSRLDYMLNFLPQSAYLNRNGTYSDYGDVVDMLSSVNANNDVFVINFDNSTSSSQSNQAAIVKQGFAVGLAVKKILNATGADKIILFGHSMGGLAIREYLQNEKNWLIGDNRHHVAKLITSGTPHQGSDISSFNLTNFFGKDETSEAVRDLRSSTVTNYLYGGHEANVSNLYREKDIDCNGQLGFITGLNQRPISLDLPFACIVGIGGRLSFLTGPGDDIVSEASANIFNLNYDKPLRGTLFTIDNKNQQAGNSLESTWHTKLPKETFTNQYALDEPSELEFSYEISPGKSYTGFLTPDPGGYDFDYDRYRLNLTQRGILTFKSNIGDDGGVRLFDPSRNEIKNLRSDPRAIIPDRGEYSIGIYGTTGASTGAAYHFVKYEFSTSFCPLPPRPEILISGNKVFCEGESATLSIKEDGYDSYKWYRNNIEIGTGRSVKINKTGTYTLKGTKCSISESSINQIVIEVKPIPDKPTIRIENDSLISSAKAGNQWYANGELIAGETGQSLKNLGSKSYTVIVSDNGCSARSDVLTITGGNGELEKTTKLFPNPSSGSFNVETHLTGNLTFSVFDLQGVKLATKTKSVVTGKTELEFKIGPGVYLLEINLGTNKFYKKILVE